MYFAVKKYLRIGGKHYKPCISYPLTENLRSTVVRLVEKGEAETSETPIFFQNGFKIGEIRAEEPKKDGNDGKNASKKGKNALEKGAKTTENALEKGAKTTENALEKGATADGSAEESTEGF